MAVTAPKRRRRRGRNVKRLSSKEARRVRTRFGRVEEILGGRKRLVGRCHGGATLELVITWCKRATHPKRREDISANSDRQTRPERVTPKKRKTYKRK
jgi:hypothetical protein